MTRHARVAALMMACATVVRAGQPPSGQPQTPTFRVAVDYVEVDVVVTDANSNSIRDLNKDDFQIFEDGKPQTIANFVPVDIPVERATQPFFATHTIEPDVRTNVQPFAGRMYVMVLDAAHTLPQNTPRTRAAARSFINENLGANDLMAVVGVDGAGGGGGSGQEFTNNKRLLLAAVDSFRGDAPGSATLSRIGGAVRTAPELSAARAAAGQTPPPLGDDGGFESDRNARALVEELTAVADWFSVVHGLKKSILLFSEGSADMQDFFQNGGGSNTATRIQARMQDLVRTATKANVAIYAIDPRGLQGLAASIELQGVTGEGLGERARLARQSLESFANPTGGFAVVNTNQMVNAFDRIVNENSSYYILAYYPPNPKRDGKYHDIDVRVTRPGVNVRFRRGYANPSGKAPVVNAGVTPELADAIQSPMPISGLAMMVFAAPFKGPAPIRRLGRTVESRSHTPSSISTANRRRDRVTR
jgi:VWFA-related protein